jgi:hypothetical protein
MNLTNRLIRRCRKLDDEQKQKYIELGKSCEDSLKESLAKAAAEAEAAASGAAKSSDK